MVVGTSAASPETSPNASTANSALRSAGDEIRTDEEGRAERSDAVEGAPHVAVFDRGWMPLWGAACHGSSRYGECRPDRCCDEALSSAGPVEGVDDGRGDGEVSPSDADLDTRSTGPVVVGSAGGHDSEV